MNVEIKGSYREILEQKHEEEPRPASRYQLLQLAEVMGRKHSTSFDPKRFHQQKKVA